MNMKVAMISLMGGQPQRLSSHNAGYTFMLREILRSKGYEVTFLRQRDHEQIHAFDTICINNGVNFKEGAWNFIGGPPETLAPLLHSLLNFEGRVFSFNERIRLFDLVNARKELTHLRKGFIWPQVETIYTNENGPKLIIGDSHGISTYRPNWGISRTDGKTLHGALRDDGKFIRDEISQVHPISDVHLYFGNIDMRFHMGRQSIPMVAASKLALDYLEFIKSLLIQGLNITIQGLIPIEDESRKIPGSGLYLKKPFFGTQEKRQECVNLFNTIMEDASLKFGYTFNAWSLGDELSFDDMESRQSVHIRPSSYYYDEFKNLMP